MNQPPPALIKTSTHSNQVNLVKPSSSPYLNSKPNHSIHPSTSTLNSQSIHPIQEDPTAPSNHRFYNRFNLSSLQCSILALLGLQSIAIISILSSTVSKIRKEIQLDTPQLTTVSTYLVIFIIANVFSILMALDSLLNKNVAQLISLCLFNVLMTAYGAVLPKQIKRALESPGGAVSLNGARVGTSCNMYVSCYGVQYLYDDIQGWIIAIPVITGGCSCLLGYLTWLIYKEFGWDIFKQIGADLRLKRIVQQKYILSMLQKFNLFFFIGFSIQFLMLSSAMTSVERALTIIALPLSLVVIILAELAVRNEVKWMIGAYAFVWLGAMSYFTYKLVRIFQEPAYASAVRSLSLFSVLTILLLFATGITVGLCYQSFGRGLKTHVVKSPWLALMKQSGPPVSPTAQTRMSLD